MRAICSRRERDAPTVTLHFKIDRVLDSDVDFIVQAQLIPWQAANSPILCLSVYSEINEQVSAGAQEKLRTQR